MEEVGVDFMELVGLELVFQENRKIKQAELRTAPQVGRNSLYQLAKLAYYLEV